MMRVLVLFDSLYGNTEKIAHAIAQGFGPDARVSAVRVGDFKPEDLGNVDLLVVGSPTQGFRPTKPIAEALKGLEPTRMRGLRAAAFDTRFGEVRLRSGALRLLVRTAGFAAPNIGQVLKKAGTTLVAPPEGFFVEDTEGPLEPGELERAAAWGKSVLQTAQRQQ